MADKPKAIFFDWDGTLVDTLDFVFKAHNHVRAELGEAQWTRDEFKVHTKFSSVQLYPRIYGDRAQLAMATLEKFMNENHLKPENLVLLSGVQSFLEDAQKSGIVMGVVSNKRHMFITREVDHMGLKPYFASIVGAGVAAQDKPSADPLLFALKESGIAPGPDVWFVGDTEPDILCARAAGCTAVLLHQDKDHQKLIAAHNPDVVVRDIVSFRSAAFTP